MSDSPSFFALEAVIILRFVVVGVVVEKGELFFLNTLDRGCLSKSPRQLLLFITHLPL